MFASASELADYPDRDAGRLPGRRLPDGLSAADSALVDLGRQLRERGYRFITITPLSHRRVLARARNKAATLQDIFGWSRPFAEGDVEPGILGLLSEAGALERSGDQLRSLVRFSTLGDQLFAHSAFPTEQADAVFFGPDTYRFALALDHVIPTFPRRHMRVLDIGAGSGAGGLHAAALLHDASIVLTDINQNALRFSRINAVLNDVPNVAVIESDLYADVDGQFDLVISNPPYLVDSRARVYRHGGGTLGSDLSLKIAEQGIDRLAPGGALFLYTGSAIVDGVDAFHESLRERLNERPVRFAYEEIDPDVFGEELEASPYDQADRIAVVAVTMEA
jgi:methylase of polypeptide subunit release factors